MEACAQAGLFVGLIPKLRRAATCASLQHANLTASLIIVSLALSRLVMSASKLTLGFTFMSLALILQWQAANSCWRAVRYTRTPRAAAGA